MTIRCPPGVGAGVPARARAEGVAEATQEALAAERAGHEKTLADPRIEHARALEVARAEVTERLTELLTELPSWMALAPERGERSHQPRFTPPVPLSWPRPVRLSWPVSSPRSRISAPSCPGPRTRLMAPGSSRVLRRPSPLSGLSGD